MKVAMLLACSSFEGYFVKLQGQTTRTYLEKYRNDWAWYYGGALVENGITPILYIPSHEEEGRFKTETGIEVRFLPLRRWYKPLDNRWVKRLCRTNRFSLYLDDRLNTMAFMSSLKAGLEEDGVDLLYVQEYWNGRFDHIVSRVDVPVTAADHGGVARGVLKWFKKSAFAKVPSVYCQSKNECDIVRRYGGVPILLPNGCDTKQFDVPEGENRRKNVLTVVRLINRQKRTTDLIEALAHMSPDWTLDIVGRGPDLELMQKRAESAGVASRVRFHGFMDRSSVCRMLQTCGVFSMPSDNEAMALAALEAMSCGSAVVLSRIRSFEALVEDGVNGRLVNVGDQRAIAAAIQDAWENRDRFGRQAAETVREHFNSEDLYRKLAETLRQQSLFSRA